MATRRAQLHAALSQLKLARACIHDAAAAVSRPHESHLSDLEAMLWALEDLTQNAVARVAQATRITEGE